MIGKKNVIQPTSQSHQPNKNIQQQTKSSITAQQPKSFAPPSTGLSRLAGLHWPSNKQQSKAAVPSLEKKINAAPASMASQKTVGGTKDTKSDVTKKDQTQKSILGNIVGKGVDGVKDAVNKGPVAEKKTKGIFSSIVAKGKEAVKDVEGADPKSLEGVKETFSLLIKDKKAFNDLIGKGSKAIEGMKEVLGSEIEKAKKRASEISKEKDALSQMNEQERKEYFQGKYKDLIACKDEEVRSTIIYMIEDQMTKDDKMNMVYNVDGEYGGNQGSPKERFEKAVNGETDSDQDFILHMQALLPDKSNDEIQKYLDDYDDVGCGYMAMTNTIFVEYANRPDEFEKTFGFPMYQVDASNNISYNFDYLATDMYNNSNNIGEGTSYKERKKIMENYLGDKGVDVNVTKKKKNVDGIEESLDNGQAILRQNPNTLYNMDGTLRQNADGGHAITVTGVDSNGNLIVSSWGEQLLVKPSDYPGFNLLKPSTWGKYLDYEEVTFN